ncbi:unnamed protein product [Nippostrongylus brasiliensis]|uniref:PI3K/PI4K domain-containing protein n=1 Tax=Nippostrongylus brasiliensis TaxID=27835 RepID=A0A0N4YIW0_NIPBR|nr:unnamed protein product [Nippostrongylus brasiliensis]
MLFLSLSGKYLNQSFERFNQIYEESVPVQDAVYSLFLNLCIGYYAIENKEKSGCPTGLDLDLLRNELQADPCQTSRELSYTFSVLQSTDDQGLKSIGKVRKLTREACKRSVTIHNETHMDV